MRLAIGRTAVLCYCAVLATTGSVLASSARASMQASGPLPCGAALHRLAGGTRLSVSLTCTEADVAIVRVEFPHTVKLRAQTPFAGASCRDSTASTWYCLFMAGAPAETKIIGTVKFATAIPHAPQHARLVFYLGSFSSSSDLPAAMVGINPNPETGAFTY